MSKEQIEKIREDLAKAEDRCPAYCEYSCASCAADSRLEDDGVKNVRLLLAEIDRLREALQFYAELGDAIAAGECIPDGGEIARKALGEEK